jgi:hypothetical protein
MGYFPNFSDVIIVGEIQGVQAVRHWFLTAESYLQPQVTYETLSGQSVGQSGTRTGFHPSFFRLTILIGALNNVVS